MHTHPPILSLSFAWPALVAALAATSVACNHPKPTPPSLDIAAPHQSLEAVPTAPLSGTIHGAPFRLTDARYTIDQRRGYEKVDIVLSAGTAADRCAPVSPAEASAVWIRHPGTDKLEPTKLKIAPRHESKWEVHYQAHDKNGWTGNRDAAALFAVREVRADRTLIGDLSVCFADDTKSCVSGSFEAHYCAIAIDAPVRGVQPPERAPDKPADRHLAPLPATSASVGPSGGSPR